MSHYAGISKVFVLVDRSILNG